MSAEPAPRFDPNRRRAVTLSLLLVSALASFESTVVSTAMPTIIGDLGGLPLYAWVFSVYLLTSTVAMPVYGRLADIYGRRRLLLFAIGVFLSGATACAFARTMPQLIGARALQGLGAAGLVPIAMTVAADIYSLEQRARVQALFSGVWGFSALVGPLLGAFLTVHFGWRSVFTINLPLGVVAFAIVATRMRESRASLPDPIDLAGSLALAVGVTLVLVGVLRAPGRGIAGASVRIATLGAGVAVLVGFAWLETRREHPLIPPDFVPLFVQGARGGTAAAAGAVVTPLVFMWAVSAGAAGRIIMRFGFRRTARLGAVLVLAGLAGLVAAALVNAGVGWISAACGMVGAGLGPTSLAQVLAIQHVALERQRGIATSLVPFFRTVGGSVGVGALGGVFAAGLAPRLGNQTEAASRLLSGVRAPAASGAAAIDPIFFRDAIERSLLPVFTILLCLAAINLFLTSGFPEATATAADAPHAAEGLV
ncbi:MAG: MFS transporter [Acidobacteriota bacterium]|nr:MFS transporter [Acidobacteriota bacterium]